MIALRNQELESLNVGCNVWSFNKKMTEIFGISKSFKMLIITNTRIILAPQSQLASWIRLKTLKTCERLLKSRYFSKINV